jgi:hypothetical protein
VERALREESATVAIPAMVNRTTAKSHDVTMLARKWNNNLFIMMLDLANCCKGFMLF